MAIDHVRVSSQAREQLIRLKRHTGVENWNVLCRWALCVSLAEKTPPPTTKIVTDSNIEMPWRVFGGKYADVYLALVKQRCANDGLTCDDDTVATQFKLHLHRGIAYLAGDRKLRSIAALLTKAQIVEGAQ